MAKRTLTITFNNPINVSVQVGDIVYYLNSGAVVELGKLLTISGKTITCEMDQNQANPSNNSFILFSKDNRKNLTSITGYYAEVEMKNDSQEYAEIFAVGSEIFESSK
tara:strand:- start:787 stop:1110 length:324 start_codon:yes stop_codon:yes gene_type:complete